MTVSGASRNSWKVLPLPARREPLNLFLSFSDVDADKLRQGLIPASMDDRWFIFFEDGWLYFHRSWTGACIYAVRLDGSPMGVRVIDSWASRDVDHYNSPGADHDRETVTRLIQSLLRR
ncbi:hypothetical protein Y958_00725 [Nitrospirillum viridazoti CBAmc]|uniref:TIR domain-containing protein n=1 Tax=Nitrospirillum viridazoti CBAmc TaxID=1441467 RepID=A0A248JL93_9PROT|nr:hypothetical protein Y958_00725 [Nitrospirillum amazonense CBAmc]